MHGWRALARYHRYEVSGLGHLATGPALIVGYHGRPIAHDLCMLQVRVLDTYGHMPHAIFHRGFAENAFLRAVLDGSGGVIGDGDGIQEAVARGEHIVVTPGGTREGTRSSLHRHRVHWGGRTGYLKLALKYGLPMVPVASHGADNTYLGLNDGEATAKKYDAKVPLWIGIGVGGLWPAALPFPCKIRQRIGAPIRLPAGLDPNDREALLVHHRHMVDTVQGLLDQARRGDPEPPP